MIWKRNTQNIHVTHAQITHNRTECSWLTFLPPFDVDALSVFSAPHQFRRREAVRLACECNILIFSNGYRRLRAIAVYDIGRDCKSTSKSQQVAAENLTTSVPCRVWKLLRRETLCSQCCEKYYKSRLHFSDHQHISVILHETYSVSRVK